MISVLPASQSWPREYAPGGIRENRRPSDLLWGPDWLAAAVARTPKNKSCFASVYSFSRIKEPNGPGGCVDYSSARVDTLFLDFDGPRSWEDARRFDGWACPRGLKPRWYFSGSKGWHAYVDFPPWPGEPSVIRPAVTLLRDLSGCASIDLRSADGPARVARVPGTIHPSTGLRCVPVHPTAPEEAVFRAALAPPRGDPYNRAALARMNALPAYALLSLPPPPEPSREGLFCPSNHAVARLSAVGDSIEAGVSSGARTLGALAVACHARISGQDEGAALARLSVYASRCSPPLARNKWETQARSAYRALSPGALMRWVLAEIGRGTGS